MANTNSKSLFGIFFAMTIATLAGYFIFAAVQGEYGLFERVKLEADRDILRAELQSVTGAVEALENKTRRLSDDYLDLDLLDERARDVLGLARADEILIQ